VHGLADTLQEGRPVIGPFAFRPAAGLIGLLLLAQSAPWPIGAWPEAPPASVPQATSESLSALDRDIRSGAYGHVNHLFVAIAGQAVARHRYARDYRAISRGRVGPIGCGEGCADPAWMHPFNYFHPDFHPYFRGQDAHSLQSVTKSIAATIVGIALGRGEIAALDRPFLEYFPDRDQAGLDPRLRRATLDDLLTMRSGIEWHEGDRPLDDTNTTVQLERSRDWLAFTLAQPMDADPGTKWTYNSGGSMLLSGIVKAATGRFIDAYADEHLFQPLGIRNWHWKRTPTGHPDTEGGLYLGAEDLARIGYLYLRDGVWNGRRVLPEGWVARATARHVRGLPGGWDYGYQWWLTARGGMDVWAGRGFGGQFLVVVPARDIVAVVNAWNVFGGAARSVLPALLDALVAPAG
jgi:CubicO group peptidase (beta-lactamase class C family)